MSLDSESLALFLSSLRRFVDQELITAEAAVSETDEIPTHLVQQMRELGLFGLSIPEAYGGAGLNMAQEVAVAFELGRTSPAFRSRFGTNIGIGSQALIHGGTEAQKQRYLPKLASGEMTSAFALTEPEAGSDAASIRTTAKRVNGGYVLNGNKRYITNAPQADVFTVIAKTPSPEQPKSISAFLVEANTTGLSVGQPDKKMGQRGAHTADVVFEQCFVPDNALLGEEEGTGFRAAMQTLDKGRLHIAAVCVGAAKRLIDESLKYATERQQFGKPLADFQLIQAMLADSQTEYYAAQCMVKDAAERRDAGDNTTLEASCCKLFASEMVGKVADRAVQIFGGAGYMAEYPIERFYRDVRLFRLYEGTSQIQQLIIAKQLRRAVET